MEKQNKIIVVPTFKDTTEILSLWWFFFLIQISTFQPRASANALIEVSHSILLVGHNTLTTSFCILHSVCGVKTKKKREIC